MKQKIPAFGVGRKAVLYLDQNAISEMAKALLAPVPSNAQEQWLDLFRRIHKLVRFQILVCPTSENHHVESHAGRQASAFEDLADALSGGVSFRAFLDIETEQFRRALHAFVDDLANKVDLRPEEVMTGPLSTWTPPIRIGARLGGGDGYREFLEGLRAGQQPAMDAIWTMWKSSKETFEEIFAKEVHAAPVPGTVTWMNLAMTALREQPDPGNLLQRFRLSQSVEQVPHVRIRSALYASVARQVAGGLKQLERSLSMDINTISVVLSYVDAIFVDNFCAARLSEKPVRAKIPARSVFSKRTMNELTNWLDELWRRATLEHFEAVAQLYGLGIGQDFNPLASAHPAGP